MKKKDVLDNEIKRFNKTGIFSFIVSLIGIFILGLPCGLVALITGIIGLTSFKPEQEKGRWMAITGLVIGILDIIISSIYIVAVGAGIA